MSFWHRSSTSIYLPVVFRQSFRWRVGWHYGLNSKNETASQQCQALWKTQHWFSMGIVRRAIPRPKPCIQFCMGVTDRRNRVGKVLLGPKGIQARRYIGVRWQTILIALGKGLAVTSEYDRHIVLFMSYPGPLAEPVSLLKHILQVWEWAQHVSYGPAYSGDTLLDPAPSNGASFLVSFLRELPVDRDEGRGVRGILVEAAFCSG